MKKLFLVLICFWISVGISHGADSGYHLFMLSGQSNMAKMDPKLSFTPTVAKKFGKEKIIVVKDAQRGTPIEAWYKKGKVGKSKKSGALYDRLLGKVTDAIKGKKIKTMTFVWMQGESDAKSNGKNYATCLRGVLGQLRSDLKRNDLNVVIGRISDHNDEKKFPQWDLVRKALVQVAESEPSGAWVNTDDLNDKKKKKNDLHYTSEGYKTLGLRFAEKAIELIGKKKK
jgi:hypothetical protein